MDKSELASYRLINQQISRALYRTPSEVVAALGAVQAQDYPGALWAIGLRLEGATQADLEGAIASQEIVRTWPMRGTLHFVAAADVRWMLELLTPRIVAGAVRRIRQLELDETILARSRDLIVKALEGNRQLTRSSIYEVLENAGISTAGQRGLQVLWVLAQRGVICFGAHQGKQPSFAILEEWVPKPNRLGRDDALAELAKRYFVGHGPATLRDFVWWSGLRVSDARSGLENAASQLAQETVDGVTYWMPQDLPELIAAPPVAHLLPAFDEYTIGYRDRSAVIDPDIAKRTARSIPQLLFLPKIVVDGQIVGTWKRELGKGVVTVKQNRLTTLSSSYDRAIAAAAERYGRFMDVPVRLQ